jgi:hypothetical protein
MTPWQNRVTELTRRMADDMKVRNYSQRTIDAYTYHVGKFADFLGKSPLEATAEDVRSFQLHMIDVRKLKWSSFNQAVCGLRFFFRTTCPQSWHVDMLPFRAGWPAANSICREGQRIPRRKANTTIRQTEGVQRNCQRCSVVKK